MAAYALTLSAPWQPDYSDANTLGTCSDFVAPLCLAGHNLNKNHLVRADEEKPPWIMSLFVGPIPSWSYELATPLDMLRLCRPHGVWQDLVSTLLPMEYTPTSSRPP
jgi:hypothetical protein